MTHLRRLNRLPGTYFVTSNTWQRRTLFSKEPPARLFIVCLFHYRNEGRFLLHEFVVMPDHFHLLLTPTTDVTLERALQLVKGGSSYRIRQELGYKFPIWQTGFDDHRIRSLQDYEQRRSYIHLNPVREKLVDQAEKYPYSSLHPNFKTQMDAWEPKLTSVAKANARAQPVTAGLKPGPDEVRPEAHRGRVRSQQP